jgi:hypothetical protein
MTLYSKGETKMAKNTTFVPKTDVAASWVFTPSAKIRKQYPNAELEELGMELQEGEVISLKVKSQKILDANLVIEIAEGRVDLVDFESNWEKGEASDDAVVWDIGVILENWSSED